MFFRDSYSDISHLKNSLNYVNHLESFTSYDMYYVFKYHFVNREAFVKCLNKKCNVLSKQKSATYEGNSLKVLFDSYFSNLSSFNFKVRNLVNTVEKYYYYFTYKLCVEHSFEYKNTDINVSHTKNQLLNSLRNELDRKSIINQISKIDYGNNTPLKFKKDVIYLEISYSKNKRYIIFVYISKDFYTTSIKIYYIFPTSENIFSDTTSGLFRDSNEMVNYYINYFKKQYIKQTLRKRLFNK